MYLALPTFTSSQYQVVQKANCEKLPIEGLFVFILFFAFWGGEVSLCV